MSIGSDNLDYPHLGRVVSLGSDGRMIARAWGFSCPRYYKSVQESHHWYVTALLDCRRLGVRYERRANLLQGLLHLACALFCFRAMNTAIVSSGVAGASR